uniref:Cilia- and flagella-associated protein HOATZ n=2 Tax=Meleagris gallopavo TaxID=9103 RepID=G1MY74_MELGA
MERGHQSAAPRGPTEPDGPLVFAGSSPADVEFARIFWSTAVLPPLSESSLCPTNLRREGPSSPGLSPAHRRTPSAAHGVQKAEAKEKYRQQAKKKEEILALLRKQREERIAKELISRPHKPKMKSNQVSRQKALEAEREDQEAVKALR